MQSRRVYQNVSEGTRRGGNIISPDERERLIKMRVTHMRILTFKSGKSGTGDLPLEYSYFSRLCQGAAHCCRARVILGSL